MNKTAILDWDDLEDRNPTHALVAGVDLVVVRTDDSVSVPTGRRIDHDERLWRARLVWSPPFDIGGHSR